ncbi:hypothetical protein PR048_033417 [Dryococelus australis]|uniref:Reverse transcriptase Ty1/copia-type domain-containing protein n=1 Tax=Dryococelus australis TaxID=614101 RepID=A0ABQ9G081_9NEOP|nr:hypothetical protein PR048_033417 [Dryococelus australis]
MQAATLLQSLELACRVLFICCPKITTLLRKKRESKNKRCEALTARLVSAFRGGVRCNGSRTGLPTMLQNLYSVLHVCYDAVHMLIGIVCTIFESTFHIFKPPALKPVEGEIALKYSAARAAFWHDGRSLTSHWLCSRLLGVKRKGKELAVVGASQGVGREFAVELASLGAVVVCWDVDKEANQETVKAARSAQGCRGKTHAYHCDVSDRDQVLRTARLVQKEVGDVSILIQCNSAESPRSSLAQFTHGLSKVMATNVFSHFWVSRPNSEVLEAFLPAMKERNHGHVVLLSSVAGLNGIGQRVMLHMSQFAMKGLAESLKEELRVTGLSGIHLTLAHVHPSIVSHNLHASTLASRGCNSAAVKRVRKKNEKTGSHISNKAVVERIKMDHSEVCELSLVEKLKEPSDFQLWKFKVNILFKSQGLYCIVCGEVKAPKQVEEKRSADSRTETDMATFKAAVKKCYECGSNKHLAGFHKTDTPSKKQGVSAVKCFSCQKTGQYGSGLPSCDAVDTKHNSLLEDTRAVKTDIGLAKKSASINAESVGRVVTDYCELKEVLYVPQLSMNILSVGSITQNAESVGRVVTDYCELKEVLYVPQLSKNILSVGSITQNGGEVNFTKNEVAVIKENEVLIRGRKVQMDLYTSAPYMPQHQGTTEQFNRTMLDKVRALMLDPAAPKDLWSEAAYTATYLINRSPDKRTDSNTCNEVNDTSVMLPVLADEQRDSVNESQEGENSENMATEMTVLDRNSDSEELFHGFETRIETREESVGIQERASKRNRRTLVRYEDYLMLIYEEALSCPVGRHWKVAVEEEKQALIKNKTWTVMKKEDVPAGQRILTSKWIFKKREDGKYKARLVVRGFLNSGPMQALLEMALREGYVLRTFDVKTAFLYGYLEKPVYLYPPPPPHPEGVNISGVCRLTKLLYSLKQAPMRWNVRITDNLKLAGMCQLKSEPCVFKNSDGSVILGLYVDFGIVVGKDCRVVDGLFPGMEIMRNEKGLHLNQTGAMAQLLEAYNMTEAKPALTLAVERKGEEKEGQNRTFPYRKFLGSLMYLSNKTSRSVENPSEEDIVSIKRVLRYLKGTENLGIRCDGSSPMEELVDFCDANFAGDPESRRSTTDYVIYYCGGPISWCARKQPVVTLSTAEAEYIAAAECTKELMYLKAVLEETLGKESFALFWIACTKEVAHEILKAMRRNYAEVSIPEYILHLGNILR